MFVNCTWIDINPTNNHNKSKNTKTAYSSQVYIILTFECVFLKAILTFESVFLKAIHERFEHTMYSSK